MDNIVRPDDNIAISKPHNIKEAKDRLDGLVGTFHRLVSRLVSIPLVPDDNDNEEANTHKSDSKSETLDQSAILKEPTDESIPEEAMNESAVPTKEMVVDPPDPKETPDTVKPPTDSRPSLNGKDERKRTDDDLMRLLDEIAGYDSMLSPQHSTSQENNFANDANTATPDEFAVFDLSELIKETAEQCFNFDSMETDDRFLDLNFDFDSMMTDEYPGQSVESTEHAADSPGNSAESSGKINDSSENSTGHNMETKLPDEIPKSKNDTPEMKAPKCVSFLNNLFPNNIPGAKETTSEESEEIKLKRRLILSGQYKSKYSEKMAKFLGLEYDDEKLKNVTVNDQENKASCNENNIVSDKQNDQTFVEGRPRRQCTLLKKTSSEGYEKNLSRRDPKILRHNQLLMSSYHAALIEYPNEMKTFQESTPSSKTFTDKKWKSDPITIKEEKPCSSKTLNKNRNVPVNEIKAEIINQEDPGCSPTPGSTKIPSAQGEKCEGANGRDPLDRTLLESLLEEKFRGTTFTERTAKFMKSATKMEGVLMPCTSRILNTYGANKNALHRNSSFVAEKINSEVRRMKQETMMEGVHAARVTLRNKNDTFVNEENEMIFTVLFYHPVEKEYLSYNQKRTRGIPKLAMELQVLSSNTLEELCNNFLCSNDYVGCEELLHPKYYSATNLLSKNAAFEMLPTATMLIHDTLYCFQDEKKGADTGAIIYEWANSKLPKGVGPLNVGDLAKTQLIDLTIQFGYPYVFIHLGSCEHVVVFAQARKMNSNDNLYAQSYPMIKENIFRSIYCKTHENDPKLKNIKKRSRAQYLARYAIVDSDRLPDNPTLLCRSCVEEFCYDQKGNKIGNFKLFPFMQVASVVKDK